MKKKTETTKCHSRDSLALHIACSDIIVSCCGKCPSRRLQLLLSLFRLIHRSRQLNECHNCYVLITSTHNFHHEMFRWSARTLNILAAFASSFFLSTMRNAQLESKLNCFPFRCGARACWRRDWWWIVWIDLAVYCSKSHFSSSSEFMTHNLFLSFPLYHSSIISAGEFFSTKSSRWMGIEMMSNWTQLPAQNGTLLLICPPRGNLNSLFTFDWTMKGLRGYLGGLWETTVSLDWHNSITWKIQG